MMKFSLGLALTLGLCLPLPAAAQSWYCQSEHDHDGTWSRFTVGYDQTGTPFGEANWQITRSGLYMHWWTGGSQLDAPLKPPQNFTFFIELKKPLKKFDIVLTAPGQKPIKIPTIRYFEPTTRPGFEPESDEDKVRLTQQRDWTLSVYTGGKYVEQMAYRTAIGWDEMTTLYATYLREAREKAKDLKRQCVYEAPEDEPDATDRSQ